MEKRKITVIQTKNQRKSVIMSDATTLSELKRDLRNNDIDYTNMAFFEGTSKTELKADSAILPHDVPYKGRITNELVFMLTNTNKKIKSGNMSRSEAYNAIKSMGLQGACIDRFGKNFTMCKTVDLIKLIENNSKAKPASKVESPKVESSKTETNNKEKTETTAVKAAAPSNNGDKCVDTVARNAIDELIAVLVDNKMVDYEEVESIINTLGSTNINTTPLVTTTSSEEYKPKSASSYTDNEIDDMFSDMDIK